MGIEDLSQLEILQGFSSLIYAIFGSIIGLIIALKFIQYKQKELLFVGTSLILITAPWYSGGISFLTYISFDYIFNDRLYFFINYGFIAVALLCWISAMSLLIFTESKKKIMISFSIICGLYEILFIIMLIVDPSLLGAKEGRFNSDAELVPTIFLVFGLLITIITMAMFIRECFRSTNLKVKWKGRFLLIAMTFMVIGSFMDAVVTVSYTSLIIVRFLLIGRIIFSYLGWLLPDRVARWLIKESS
jgi:hypothetical protein